MRIVAYTMGNMNELDQVSPQERMIQQQIVERGIDEPRVLAALRAVPRERFFPSDQRAAVYADRPSPIGHEQTISQPYIVALMTQRLEVAAHHKVLEVGTGSGYQTAILSQLAREVFTIERVKPLLDDSWERLMGLGLRNIHFRYGDGTLGWPQAAPFDRVLIAAAARAIPRELLLNQLADDGVAVLPVGDQTQQMLLHIRRLGNDLLVTDLCPVRFVELIEQAR
jgi:protein-L-isoaspartate(D-aspartate) O-methyltransferase